LRPDHGYRQKRRERYGEAAIWAGSPAMSREGFARLAESLVSGGFLRRMPSYEACVEEV